MHCFAISVCAGLFPQKVFSMNHNTSLRLREPGLVAHEFSLNDMAVLTQISLKSWSQKKITYSSGVNTVSTVLFLKVVDFIYLKKSPLVFTR